MSILVLPQSIVVSQRHFTDVTFEQECSIMLGLVSVPVMCQPERLRALAAGVWFLA